MYTLKKVRSIIPPGVQTIPWEEGAYICISMNNTRTREEESLIDMWKWVKRHTNSVSVLIGDYLHRKNIIISKGLNEAMAIKEAMMMGEERKVLLTDTAKKEGVKLDFISTKVFNDSPTFASQYERLDELISSEKQLKDLINKTVTDFLGRQIHMTIDMKAAKDLCYEYLIEELVIFESLAKEGKLVSIYPGKHLQITKKIVNGQLKGVSPYLAKMMLFELHYKPK